MISVIITSANEKKTLLKALNRVIKNLKELTLENWEILIVSPDKESGEMVKDINNPKIKFLKDKGEGKPAALNQAFKKVTGDLIILTDGDVYIEDKSIYYILNLLNKKNVGAVTGRPVSILKKSNIFGYWSYFLTNAAHQMRLKNNSFPCSGYLYGIKNVIPEIPENSLADDGVITKKLRDKGLRVKYQPKAIVYVKYPNNFKDWLKQKVRSTGGYLQDQTSKDRSFFQEIRQGIKLFFSYPNNLKEYFWTFLLYLGRIYLWLLIFWNIKIKNKDFKKIWQRIESTK
ncbi:MAG TPA: glycosyltransferase family 2 protein [Patescibacteria group bacterium]|nr:glycosyltransferase family 2 protein [Patescibacteria group bacterium]